MSFVCFHIDVLEDSCALLQILSFSAVYFCGWNTLSIEFRLFFFYIIGFEILLFDQLNLFLLIWKEFTKEMIVLLDKILLCHWWLCVSHFQIWCRWRTWSSIRWSFRSPRTRRIPSIDCRRKGKLRKIKLQLIQINRMRFRRNDLQREAFASTHYGTTLSFCFIIHRWFIISSRVHYHNWLRIVIRSYRYRQISSSCNWTSSWRWFLSEILTIIAVVWFNNLILLEESHWISSHQIVKVLLMNCIIFLELTLRFSRCSRRIEL